MWFRFSLYIYFRDPSSLIPRFFFFRFYLYQVAYCLGFDHPPGKTILWVHRLRPRAAEGNQRPRSLFRGLRRLVFSFPSVVLRGFLRPVSMRSALAPVLPSTSPLSLNIWLPRLVLVLLIRSFTCVSDLFICGVVFVWLWWSEVL